VGNGSAAFGRMLEKGKTDVVLPGSQSYEARTTSQISHTNILGLGMKHDMLATSIEIKSM
jgi:hypothetical protein